MEVERVGKFHPNSVYTNNNIKHKMCLNIHRYSKTIRLYV